MRWLKGLFMKGNDKTTNREVTDPAQKEIRKSEDRLSRINRILKEARQAEQIIQHKG